MSDKQELLQMMQLESYKMRVAEEAICAQGKLKIQDAIKNNHPHAHNLVSCELRRVSTKAGIYYANRLIDELKLETLFGIKKVNVDG